MVTGIYYCFVLAGFAGDYKSFILSYYYYYYYYYYYFCSTADVLAKCGSAGSPLCPAVPILEHNFWDYWNRVLLRSRCPSCHPTISVKPL